MELRKARRREEPEAISISLVASEELFESPERAVLSGRKLMEWKRSGWRRRCSCFLLERDMTHEQSAVCVIL